MARPSSGNLSRPTLVASLLPGAKDGWWGHLLFSGGCSAAKLPRVSCPGASRLWEGGQDSGLLGLEGSCPAASQDLGDRASRWLMQQKPEGCTTYLGFLSRACSSVVVSQTGLGHSVASGFSGICSECELSEPPTHHIPVGLGLIWRLYCLTVCCVLGSLGQVLLCCCAL